jgi:hypothetical protein
VKFQFQYPLVGAALEKVQTPHEKFAAWRFGVRDYPAPIETGIEFLPPHQMLAGTRPQKTSLQPPACRRRPE